jgi:hypothetical protein
MAEHRGGMALKEKTKGVEVADFFGQAIDPAGGGRVRPEIGKARRSPDFVSETLNEDCA